MRIVDVDSKGEDERATLVHSYENHTMVSNLKISRPLASAKHLEMWRSAAQPSSGVIVSVKLRRSAGSGKLVFMVDGRSSSVKSGKCMRLSFCQTGIILG